MIVDTLAAAARYHALGTRIARGLDYLAGFDLATPDGRHEIDGDDVFALVQRYHTTPGAEKRFEAHRRYVDLQLVAAGRERILHAPTRLLHPDTEHDEERDVRFFQEPGASSSVLLGAGDFAILFPEDGHKPGCMAGGRDAVVKVVVKARA